MPASLRSTTAPIANAPMPSPRSAAIALPLTSRDVIEREVVAIVISDHLGVVDTGNGISANFLPHVFERLRQAEDATTQRHTGLGLGLSIVRQLVELHAGTVPAASPGVGQGATFTVRLPIAPGLARTSSGSPLPIPSSKSTPWRAPMLSSPAR